MEEILEKECVSIYMNDFLKISEQEQDEIIKTATFANSQLWLIALKTAIDNKNPAAMLPLPKEFNSIYLRNIQKSMN